jgi:PadR family transcriptional regulator, regulatory protein PadR
MPAKSSPATNGRATKPPAADRSNDVAKPQAGKPLGEIVRGPIKSKTIFPVLVLHLLAQQPDHGLGLMQRIEVLCEGLIGVNTNTIYPLLRRLEERGFIIGEWEHPTKRSRRYYRITSDGVQRLERIKSAMLPYLDIVANTIQRLRSELYDLTDLPSKRELTR